MRGLHAKDPCFLPLPLLLHRRVLSAHCILPSFPGAGIALKAGLLATGPRFLTPPVFYHLPIISLAPKVGGGCGASRDAPSRYFCTLHTYHISHSRRNGIPSPEIFWKTGAVGAHLRMFPAAIFGHRQTIPLFTQSPHRVPIGAKLWRGGVGRGASANAPDRPYFRSRRTCFTNILCTGAGSGFRFGAPRIGWVSLPLRPCIFQNPRP